MWTDPITTKFWRSKSRYSCTCRSQRLILGSLLKRLIGERSLALAYTIIGVKCRHTRSTCERMSLPHTFTRMPICTIKGTIIMYSAYIYIIYEKVWVFCFRRNFVTKNQILSINIIYNISSPSKNSYSTEYWQILNILNIGSQACMKLYVHSERIRRFFSSNYSLKTFGLLLCY